MEQNDFNLALHLGDNSLILGQRLTEWCGHGPILEQDIALSNISLDLLGQARNYLTLAGEIEGQGRTEDDFAFRRDNRQFYNFLLCELPNGDWAQTVLKQFFYDAWNYPMVQHLASSESVFQGVASKAVKEVRYHLRWSSEWVIRLGAGTEVSNRKICDALEYLWPYAGEWLMDAKELGSGTVSSAYPDPEKISAAWWRTVREVFNQAELEVPAEMPFHKGGPNGLHTEHLGYMLAEMQFLPRAYPDAKW
jgi:ring-1,2-phenylacetyl-CoA epoxidase subunit PaaC